MKVIGQRGGCMKDKMWEFFEAKFYIMLLFACMGGWTAVVLHLAHHDPQDAAWGREVFSGFMGAFLGLITGVRMSGGSNGKPNDSDTSPKGPEKP